MSQKALQGPDTANPQSRICVIVSVKRQKQQAAKGGAILKRWMRILGMTVLVMGVLGMVVAVGCSNDKADNNTTPLTLEVTEPQDESVVHVSEIVVSGITRSDAVVSINDAVVEVDEDGKFSATVTLEEGPNSIEVIASDYEGNEESQVLTLIYQQP
jgi:hypothetical protein